MANSPRTEIFFVYDLATGVPLAGAAAAMSFDSYVDDTGAAVIPQPAISEIAAGIYGFTPVFADPLHGIAYILSTGPNGNPTKVARYMRPEDYTADEIPTIGTNLTALKNFQEGKWTVHTAGPDANRLVIYAPDGVTPLKKFDLLDAAGLPTATNPYRRDPV